MNNLLVYTAPDAIDTHGDIVALWQQAVLGNAKARQALLKRIMPASAVGMTPAVEIDSLSAYRKQVRAAA